MAYSKFVLLAILALSLLLSGGESRKVDWSRSEIDCGLAGGPESSNVEWPHRKLGAKCCKQQPQFGTCESKEDSERCSKWCLDGCSTNKGGGCQAICAAPGSVCSCYC